MFSNENQRMAYVAASALHAALVAHAEFSNSVQECDATAV